MSYTTINIFPSLHAVQKGLLLSRMHFSSPSGFYSGFLCSWAIEASGMVAYVSSFATMGSLFTGLCLYIKAMKLDLKERLTFNENEGQTRLNMRRIYVDEFCFHNQILECVS